MELYEHQQKIVDRFPSRHVLVWSTGTGKTRAAIALSNKADVRTLIICPKSLAKNWKRKMEELSTLSHTSEGSVAHKVMTKEEFRRDWKDVDEYPAVIVDEAHYFFGTTSQMMKSLRHYFKRHDTKYRWLLTATPYRSNPMDIYIMASHLGQGIDYDRFRERFFEKHWYGRNQVWQPKDDIEDDIASIVKRLGSIVKKEDCIDIPDHVHEVEYMEETKPQKERREKIKDVEAIVKFTKEHQIAGGSLKGNEYVEAETFKTEKLDRLYQLTSEIDKMIVVCRYNLELERLKEDLVEDNVYVLNGATENRQEMIDEIQNKDRYVLLVNAAMSEGWELPECDTMIFWSLDFQLKNYIQMMGRIDRINHLSKNLYLHLVTSGTIDESVYESMKAKEDFQIAIYSKEQEL